MSSTYESRRYARVENFRVDDVVRAYHNKPEKLYARLPTGETDPGVQYVFDKPIKGSVEEALATIKRVLDG